MKPHASTLHSVLLLACRLLLGGVFAYASLAKIGDPVRFAEIVHNYRILPIATENILAIALPWIELGAGLLLIAGLLTRSNALLTNLLLVVFIAAISASLVRGIDMTCGCFTLNAEGRHIGWITLLVDVLLLIPGVLLLREPHITLSGDAFLASILSSARKSEG